MLAIGNLVNGRYQVTELIGHGGMSNVFKAYDRVTNATLAIKESRRTGKQDNQTMELNLATEANLLKNLYNPHLPRIYDIIEDSDHIMIIMDFVEGVSLDKYLQQNGAVPPALVIDWSIQICEVFYYLHTQNPPIIYRDMKPANLILQPDGNIMMIDFGTARTWKNSDRTSDTMLIGTEGFAAPEQFGGHGQSDARTDIFCLGATMFNLVTNHSPYLKPFGITPLGNWDPALKDCALDKIIQKCTRRDPYERFQTASELRDALIAAKSENGRTSLFARIGKKNNAKQNDWQSPVMNAGVGQAQNQQAFVQRQSYAQQQAQYEAQLRAQQEAQARAQQQARYEAQLRAQQEAQARAQQQAQYEAQLRAQQEAQARAQQQAQYEAQLRAQYEAQARAQQQAQYEAQLRAQQEAQRKAQEQAKIRALQDAKLRAQQVQQQNYINQASAPADNTDIWKILMIVAGAAGLLMLIFGIIAISGSAAGGIVMIVLALAIIGFGVYSFLQFRKSK